MARDRAQLGRGLRKRLRRRAGAHVAVSAVPELETSVVRPAGAEREPVERGVRGQERVVAPVEERHLAAVEAEHEPVVGVGELDPSGAPAVPRAGRQVARRDEVERAGEVGRVERAALRGDRAPAGAPRAIPMRLRASAIAWAPHPFWSTTAPIPASASTWRLAE